MRRACLTSARFSMVCDLIKPVGAPLPTYQPEDGPVGGWEYRQDPDSGAIIRVWIDERVPDNPDTPENETEEVRWVRDIPLMARGVMTQGIHGAGSTEKFSEIYTNVDWVKATLPASTNITKRDRVTNIRNKRSGELLWKEEEIDGYPATIFNVQGITPIFDPFSRLVEYSVLLERAEVQSA